MLRGREAEFGLPWGKGKGGVYVIHAAGFHADAAGGIYGPCHVRCQAHIKKEGGLHQEG